MSVGPTGSPGITRRMQLWAAPDGENALELHTIRLEAIRHLRREFGPLRSRKVSARIAIRLQKGLPARKATEIADELINKHQNDRHTLPPEGHPARDPRVFRKAIGYHTQAILDGREHLSERRLCDAFDVPTDSRQWVKQTIKASEACANEYGTASKKGTPVTGPFRFLGPSFANPLLHGGGLGQSVVLGAFLRAQIQAQVGAPFADQTRSPGVRELVGLGHGEYVQFSIVSTGSGDEGTHGRVVGQRVQDAPQIPGGQRLDGHDFLLKKGPRALVSQNRQARFIKLF
jgi:hypothetical protein